MTPAGEPNARRRHDAGTCGSRRHRRLGAGRRSGHRHSGSCAWRLTPPTASRLGESGSAVLGRPPALSGSQTHPPPEHRAGWAGRSDRSHRKCSIVDTDGAHDCRAARGAALARWARTERLGEPSSTRPPARNGPCSSPTSDAGSRSVHCHPFLPTSSRTPALHEPRLAGLDPAPDEVPAELDRAVEDMQQEESVVESEPVCIGDDT